MVRSSENHAKGNVIPDSSAVLTRRSLYWAAWILFVLGTFVSGTHVLGKIVLWSGAAPGSAGAPDMAHVSLLTLALFSNIAFTFTPILRNRKAVTMACKIFLVAAFVTDAGVAVMFPEFARLPGYWLWLASFAALAWAFIGFAGSGELPKVVSRKRAPATTAAADAEPAGVPQIVWMWFALTVFWLGVTAAGHSQLAAPPVAAPVAAAPLPTYLNDSANLIPFDKAAQLNAALARFEKETSNQIAVAIYPRAPTGSIEQFTIETADHSRLGRKGLDNGAILFVFAAERTARLEVGYGFEGALTDLDAHRILESQLAPAFAAGKYADGLDAALGAIFATVQDAYKADRMPGKAAVFWRQLQVETPKLVHAALPALNGLDLGARIGIGFFAGLLGVGIWDGFRQAIRLVRNLIRGVRNLSAHRAFGAGMVSVGLESVVDTVKVFGFVIAVIAGAAGLVIVAADGAFGGAGALVRW